MSLRSRPGLRPPGFIEPALPSSRSLPPPGRDWLHEINFDGFRLLARRDGPSVRLFSRNGYDWTERVTVPSAPGCPAAVAVIQVGPPFEEHLRTLPGVLVAGKGPVHSGEGWKL